MTDKAKVVIGGHSPLVRYTARQLSHALGHSEGHMYRSLRGAPVGSDFIAAVMVKFPDKRFEDLFSIQTPAGVLRQSAPIPAQREPQDNPGQPFNWLEATAIGLKPTQGEWDELLEENAPDYISWMENGRVAYDLLADGSIRVVGSMELRSVRRLYQTYPRADVNMKLIPAYIVNGESNSDDAEQG